MSVSIARKIICESEFAGSNSVERAASRARWRRMVERNEKAPVISAGDKEALLHIAKAFVALDACSKMRTHLSKSIETLFYT
ncbi:hypothetical protein GCM10009128_06060 [Psychrosphaera haliotis]|uniref:hypothetical protein n=1 Tax=Psychrosphaera haliotis TaxID=555083 RepID=UPI0031D7520A